MNASGTAEPGIAFSRIMKEVSVMIEFRRIMIPLDGSSLAEKAIPVATAIAKKFEGQIVLLRVLDIPTPTILKLHPEVIPGWVSEACEYARREAESYLKTLQDALRRQGFEVQTMVTENSPAEDILDAAASEAVDLIVMSSHGQSGMGRWAFGSVAYKVVQESSCPVLLVRQKPETTEQM